MTINFGQHGAKKKIQWRSLLFQTAGNRLFILPGKVNSEHLVSSRVVACLTSGTFYREII